jgi:LmbE family N-acetylglucosaminyl deacetylase
MGSKRVLFVAPHPDDVEIGCGATICAFVQASFEVACVFLTRGEGGGDPDVREKESRKACASLGLRKGKIFFGGFPDTGITDSHEVIAFLEGFVDDRLWGVFVPSVHETHQDHRHAGEACHSAFRRVGRILAYESPSVTPAFNPNVFVPIDAFVKKKWDALRCHRSQIAQNRMYLQYRSMVQLAAFRGQQNGVNYAEAFEAVRLRIDPGFVARSPEILR